ncbi:hypothetical protein Ddc_00182 [Ditylenchus destructor]|nr:hypothetical protein Ddc_00182 [Ditylenchus destructor]
MSMRRIIASWLCHAKRRSECFAQRRSVVTAFLGMLIVMGVFVLSVWLLMGQIPMTDEKKDGPSKLPASSCQEFACFLNNHTPQHVMELVIGLVNFAFGAIFFFTTEKTKNVLVMNTLILDAIMNWAPVVIGFINDIGLLERYDWAGAVVPVKAGRVVEGSKLQNAKRACCRWEEEVAPCGAPAAVQKSQQLFLHPTTTTRWKSMEDLEEHFKAEHFPLYCDLCPRLHFPTERSIKYHYEKEHQFDALKVQQHLHETHFIRQLAIRQAVDHAFALSNDDPIPTAPSADEFFGLDDPDAGTEMNADHFNFPDFVYKIIHRRHSREIFQKQQEIKQALRTAVQGKFTKSYRNGSVSDLEQKLNSPRQSSVGTPSAEFGNNDSPVTETKDDTKRNQNIPESSQAASKETSPDIIPIEDIGAVSTKAGKLKSIVGNSDDVVAHLVEQFHRQPSGNYQNGCSSSSFHDTINDIFYNDPHAKTSSNQKEGGQYVQIGAMPRLNNSRLYDSVKPSTSSAVFRNNPYQPHFPFADSDNMINGGGPSHSSTSALLLNRCAEVIQSEHLREEDDALARFSEAVHNSPSFMDDSIKAESITESYDYANMSSFYNSTTSTFDGTSATMSELMNQRTVREELSSENRTRRSRPVYEKGVSYKCRKCSSSVTGPCIIKHINYRHAKLIFYRCKACNKASAQTSVTTMAQHIKSCHNGDMSLLENNYKECSKKIRAIRGQFFDVYKNFTGPDQ